MRSTWAPPQTPFVVRSHRGARSAIEMASRTTHLLVSEPVLRRREVSSRRAQPRPALSFCASYHKRILGLDAHVERIAPCPPLRLRRKQGREGEETGAAAQGCTVCINHDPGHRLHQWSERARDAAGPWRLLAPLSRNADGAPRAPAPRRHSPSIRAEERRISARRPAVPPAPRSRARGHVFRDALDLSHPTTPVATLFANHLAGAGKVKRFDRTFCSGIDSGQCRPQLHCRDCEHRLV